MKKQLFLLFFSFFIFSSFADSWTLAVMEFSFKQAQTRSESSLKAASVLPQLIIEQFSTENIRTVPEEENLDRKLNELQTQRLSLFLQLSKEYKTRDSLILTTIKPKALQKAITAQMEKIHELETKINENLENVKKAEDEAKPKIEHEKAVAQNKTSGTEGQNSEGFLSKLPFPFFRQNDENKIVTEDVVLYKTDSTVLFEPSDKALEAGFSSWDFEQEVLSAKINGLISGEITTYGDYCSVTVNLHVYPGSKVYGSVTEVGLLSDLMPLANSIARNLDSKIMNALPVLIEFEIEPKEIAKNSTITIDGNVFQLLKPDGSFENTILEETGIHNINIEAEGYEPLSFTHSFTGDSRFFVHVNLSPKVKGTAKIRLKKYTDGVFYTSRLLQSPVTKENPVADIEVNGKNILGVFTVPKKNDEDSDSSNIAFFWIPENTAFDGANIVVNAKTFDRAKNIDKRRRWMYTAYTALICSLPFTFYHLGEFTAENTAYSQGRGDYEHLKEMQQKSNICVGITAACSVWAGIELIRYLFAADRVLPAKAKIDKNPWYNFEQPLLLTSDDTEQNLDIEKNEISEKSTDGNGE